MTRWWWLVCVAIAWAGVARAEAPSCANPRSATDSLFAWTRPGQFDPALAATCMDLPADANRARLAVQLKQVLDARGLWVPVPSLSDDPEYRDASGEHRVVPMPDAFPTLVLERLPDGRWVYSRHTMEAVPELYAATFSSLSQWFQSRLPTVFYWRFAGIYLWQVLYGAILLSVAIAVGVMARMLLRSQVFRAVKRAGLRLEEADYAKTNLPIVALVTLGILLWGVPDLQLPVALSHGVRRTIEVAIALGLLVLASRVVNVFAKVAATYALSTENKLDDQLVPLLRQAAQVVVLVVGGLYLADALGFDVWKLAAGVGIGGLAFALAAQDTVANLFGSFNIFVDRPFQIGDAVRIGVVEGIVEEVGFRSTRVRTYDNSLVTIPNSQITNANVDNLGLRTRRRVRLVISVTYDTPVERLEGYVEGLRAILAAHPLVLPTYEVHVNALGASSIDILALYHIDTRDFAVELKARGQNILEFIRLAEAMDISFAFPSTSLYVESTPSEPLPRHPEASLEHLAAIAESFGPNGSLARPQGPTFPKSWSVQARRASGELEP